MGQMVPFIYRCPATGLNVQGLLANDISADKSETYETVKCLVCSGCILFIGQPAKYWGMRTNRLSLFPASNPIRLKR